jgi:hypothetical protein
MSICELNPVIIVCDTRGLGVFPFLLSNNRMLLALLYPKRMGIGNHNEDDRVSCFDPVIRVNDI